MIVYTAWHGSTCPYERPIVEHAKAPTVGEVVRLVSDLTGISAEKIMGPMRHVDIAHARQSALYVLRGLTPMSTPQIARVFGKAGHTTVMHAVQSVKIRIESGEDELTQSIVDALRNRSISHTSGGTP